MLLAIDTDDALHLAAQSIYFIPKKACRHPINRNRQLNCPLPDVEFATRLQHLAVLLDSSVSPDP
jgi:hypothetical protein